MEERDEGGNTLLLEWARGLGYGCDLKILGLLLRRGSNICARNNQGRTCLHLFIENARGCPSSTDRECLILLIKNGADVNACDDRGISVSGIAYSVPEDYDCYNNGMYKGDLWDATLSEFGHDIVEMRRGFPRTRCYSTWYMREDLERLWRGREQFCPYYDDPPIWDPEEREDCREEDEEQREENEHQQEEEDEHQREGEREEEWRAGEEGQDYREAVLQYQLPPLRDFNEVTTVQAPTLPTLGINKMISTSPLQSTAPHNSTTGPTWTEPGLLNVGSSTSASWPTEHNQRVAAPQASIPEEQNVQTAASECGVAEFGIELGPNPWL